MHHQYEPTGPGEMARPGSCGRTMAAVVRNPAGFVLTLSVHETGSLNHGDICWKCGNHGSPRSPRFRSARVWHGGPYAAWTLSRGGSLSNQRNGRSAREEVRRVQCDSTGAPCCVTRAIRTRGRDTGRGPGPGRPGRSVPVGSGAARRFSVAAAPSGLLSPNVAGQRCFPTPLRAPPKSFASTQVHAECRIDT